ncbi:MAG: cupin domain-containing protein [Hyphomicrobiaceae bacterium]
MAGKGLRLEHIVSNGQASPDNYWYDQEEAEWVVVLSGSAGIAIDGEPIERVLKPGDALYLPARCRHRVTWTDAGMPTVWLALFVDPTLEPSIQMKESISAT